MKDRTRELRHELLLQHLQAYIHHSAAFIHILDLTSWKAEASVFMDRAHSTLASPFYKIA